MMMTEFLMLYEFRYEDHGPMTTTDAQRLRQRCGGGALLTATDAGVVAAFHRVRRGVTPEAALAKKASHQYDRLMRGAWRVVN